MLINKAIVHFLLEREWKNYIYEPITERKAESVLHGAKVIDCIHANGELILRLKTIVLGRPDNEWILRIGKSACITQMNTGAIVTIPSYSIAGVESNRLPGHPFIEIKGADASE